MKMANYKRKKLKLILAKYKAWFIGSGIFALVGIVALIASCYLSGHTLKEWLTQPFAITIYILLGIVLLIGGYIICYEYRKRLGDK